MGSPAFEPIAIVGQGCVLPGCFTPSGLWQAVRDRRSLLSAPPAGVWGLAEKDRTAQPFRAGGFVRGFEKRFQPSRFDLEDVNPADLDVLFQWLLQAGRDAWLDADVPSSQSARTSVIVANLAYPSRSLTDLASDIWMQGETSIHPANRFNSGFPAMILARSLGAKGTRFCLDAACASSLYALKLSCNELHHRRSDIAVCAAVNAVDNLFLHQGFRALNAISPTGRSRPLVEGADGLVPSEGAVAVVLKRLSDVEAGEPVHAIIRGLGLANDGRRKGLLAPSADGQVEALRQAYEMCDVDPGRDVGLLECHATGTPVGDGVELGASHAIFGPGRNRPLPVGSLKSNTGHLITAAGLASVLKVAAAFKHQSLPPTRLDGEPSAAFDDVMLAPQADLTSWPAHLPARAGISTFGFGGNNAHLILEAPEAFPRPPAAGTAPMPREHVEPVVICGIGANAGPDRGLKAIVRRLMRARDKDFNRAETVAFDPKQARTPPSDLRRAEGQQIAVLDVTNQAIDGVTPVPAERAGCFVAMSTAPDAARWMLRERLAARFDFAGDTDTKTVAQDAIAPAGMAADVLGAMPNMPANRLNFAHDWRGPGFTVACEHQSGRAALRVAITQLQQGVLDMAVVAGADFASDSIHQTAVSMMGATYAGGDGAAAMVLKRRSQAEADGDVILGLVDVPDVTASATVDGAANCPIRRLYGHCHAAQDLLEGVVKVCLEASGLSLAGAGVGPRICAVRADDPPPVPRPDVVRGSAHFLWFASDSADGLHHRLTAGASGGAGPYRLVIVQPSEPRLNKALAEAHRWVPGEAPPVADGLYWGLGSKPLGELAFVFTGSASAYPQAGRGLFAAFPELGAMLAARSPHIHILAPLLSNPSLTPFQDLCSGVLNSQAQALLLREWFGLAPEAAIGLSLGETNALIAFGAWRDAERLLQDIAEGDMYERHLGHTFDVLQKIWPESDGPLWENWQISAPLPAVEAQVAREPQTDITIIYTPDSCLIGGHPDACRRVVDAIGRNRALRTGHDFLIHSRFLAPYEATWRQYHTRKTYPVPGVRFYSNGRTGSYRPSRDATAEALTRQACSTIDFPTTIETAYRDGVRTFVEIGPRDQLSKSISRILGTRDHLAVSIDRPDRSDCLQLCHAMAALFASGRDIPMAKLSERLRSILDNPWPSTPRSNSEIEQIAHKPPPPRPVSPGRPERNHRNEVEPTLAAPEIVGLDRLPHAPSQPRSLRTERIAKPAGQLRRQEPTRPSRAAAPGRSLSPAHRKPGPAPLARVAARGPAFDRDAIERGTTGKVSDLFGPLFEAQDGYTRQVRLPAPPLLLVDLITGIDAVPGEQAKGRIWTETDIDGDAWYMHGLRMRPGPLIEAGQADLSLISYMGADLQNRDDRVYRLLGCEFTFQNGPMPQAGDTLSYQIEITRHANLGEVRLFFFQYDCQIGDRLLLSVRDGQAGFFTDEELQQSKGILWSPEAAEPPTPNPVPFVPKTASTKRSFSPADLKALREGDTFACFGAGFEFSAPHSRPCGLPGGKLALIDAISAFDPEGGPWGRGYLKAYQTIESDAWFYAGHFHNDPCMPGTLMVEAALQALEIYAGAVGLTLHRDGYVFEPVGGAPARFDCRGQITPAGDRTVTYEIFIDAIEDGDTPVISAALLASCDGLKVFHCDRISLALKRAWPKVYRSEPPALVGPDKQSRGDNASLLACADAAPSEAFGQMYKRFDRESRVPRLPRPPYHFISRIRHVSSPAGKAVKGATAIAEYDLPPDAWFFTDGGNGTMPFPILSEVLLQPCGWLASHCGFALDGDAYFRNLDGNLAVHSEVRPADGQITVETRLTKFATIGPVTIVGFHVEAKSAAGHAVASLDTDFGFFGESAFEKQAGVKAPALFHDLLAAEPRTDIGIRHSFNFPENRLKMLDLNDFIDLEGGSSGLGLARGQQHVDPYAWPFRAHFFQDPVQPGSVGFGALLELLMHLGSAKGLGNRFTAPRVEYQALGTPMRWRCRGQVTPDRRKITTMVDITDIQETDLGPKVIANGVLWTDGIPIYDATGLAIRIVDAN